MAIYGVTLPVTAKLYIEIEASSEEEAIELAVNAEVNSGMIEEWSTHEAICDGNEFYGLLNEPEVYCVEE
jgi:hypothetical protein